VPVPVVVAVVVVEEVGERDFVVIFLGPGVFGP